MARDAEAQQMARDTAALIDRVESIEMQLSHHVDELWGFIERAEQEDQAGDPSP